MRSREAAEMSEQQFWEQFDPDWPFPDETEPMSDEEMALRIAALEADCGD